MDLPLETTLSNRFKILILGMHLGDSWWSAALYDSCHFLSGDAIIVQAVSVRMDTHGCAWYLCVCVCRRDITGLFLALNHFESQSSSWQSRAECHFDPRFYGTHCQWRQGFEIPGSHDSFDSVLDKSGSSGLWQCASCQWGRLSPLFRLQIHALQDSPTHFMQIAKVAVRISIIGWMLWIISWILYCCTFQPTIDSFNRFDSSNRSPAVATTAVLNGRGLVGEPLARWVQKEAPNSKMEI